MLPTLAARNLPTFIGWHFGKRPGEIVKMYVAYAKAVAGIFSFTYLLRTMFSPWKAIADVYPKKGFNLAEISSVFALNMTARGIGAVIRLGTIIFGVVMQAALLAFFVAYLLAWILFPFIIVLTVILLIAAPIV